MVALDSTYFLSEPNGSWGNRAIGVNSKNTFKFLTIIEREPNYSIQEVTAVLEMAANKKELVLHHITD